MPRLLPASKAAPTSLPINTVLRTDERVLARVTDGIYRQPGSAIRELLSNAYDADAKQVVIKTDRPRFRTLSVEDDGMGMTPAAIAHLLHHIGGSAKRSLEGAELGIASTEDPTRSPSGRRLIGKDRDRPLLSLPADAPLSDYHEDSWRPLQDDRVGSPSANTQTRVCLRTDEQGEYEAGLVTIWREPAADAASHGTTIILTDIRPQTRDTLQSRDLWEAIDADRSLGPAEARDLRPPDFHIGRVEPG